MLIALLLVLSAIKVNGEAVDHDGLRRSRQLDLDLQNIHAANEETSSTIPSSQTDGKVLGHLPTVSSSLSPEVITHVSQQGTAFKYVNSEKENELLTSRISPPSSDLVPPFNDLEQELFIKASTTTEKAKVTDTKQKKYETTTENLNFKQTVVENIRSRTTRRPKEESRNSEATNELRSYLPPQPEFSAAAQTNVAVVQPSGQNNDHDHDHHHHGDNFDICADAFHSFLCAPLKARKRITGAFPSNLRGQSSFINYQKLLPNFERETAPSNTFRNEYLPPSPSPTNLIQSTYLPPLTTKRITTTTTTTTARPYSPPRNIAESSNSNEKFYLPPLSDNRIISSPSFDPDPSIQVISTIKTAITPRPTTIKPVITSSSNLFENLSSAPTVSVFNSLSSNENSFYLPPNPNPQPAASFVSTSNSIFPITSTALPSTFVSLPVISEVSYLPPNSIFVPQTPKAQSSFPIFTTTAQPTTTFKSVNSVKSVPSFDPEPSNPDKSYLPPVIQSTTTTVKPSTPKLIPQPSNADRAYLPPDPKETAAAQISSAAVALPQVKNPFHHGRDLCTDPFHSFLCTSARPRKRITGQLPSGFRSDSSNRNELRLKPESSNQDESKLPPEKPLQGASAQNLGYKYPKPVNPLPTPSKAVTSSPVTVSTGYSYPKPDIIFPLPSQQDFNIASVTTTTTAKTPEPTFRTSEAKVVGYQYPKPDKVFPLPGSQETTKVVTTTELPSTGYFYPKPQKTFALPTEQKEVKQRPSQPTLTPQANQASGYQYPKPEQSLKLPEKKGYSYPKPEKRLELPTESGSKRLLPQANSNLDALKNLGSAEFIPVNKIEFKRSESSKVIQGLRRFGERMKKREKEAQLLKRQSH